MHYANTETVQDLGAEHCNCHWCFTLYSAQEITKKAGERWNSLSDQEKTPYYRNAQVERAKWELDLEAYKQSVHRLLTLPAI